MNYTDLYNAIIDTTENNDTTFVDNIPILVSLAERRIYNGVRIPVLRKEATGTFTASNQYLSVPADYLATWDFAVINSSTYTFLLPKDPSFIREAYPVVATTGVPKYYTQFDETTFLVGPTPASNYSYALNYFYYPESIVTADTTWLGDNFDQVLLYGCLVEAATFMKSEQDIVKLYQDQFAINFKQLEDYSKRGLRFNEYR